MNRPRAVALLLCCLSGGAAAQDTDTLVTFPASTPGVQLAGTVTRPASGSVAAAVLLSVAGPTDRDLTFGPHRFLGGLAHRLAEDGVATLRYDARGVGGSGGNLLATDFHDRAADACRALAELRERVGRAVPFGFIGLSEGAGLALVAARQCGPVAFITLLSAPVRRGAVELEDQLTRLIAGSGLPDTTRQEIAGVGRRLLTLAADSAPERHRATIDTLLRGAYGAAILPPYAFVPRDAEGRTAFVLTPWYRSQLHYDVEQAVAEASEPILAVYGALDQVIDPGANAAHLTGLRPTATVVVVPSLNHLLQEARTGSPLEYGQLPGGIADVVVAHVLTFIRRVVA